MTTRPKKPTTPTSDPALAIHYRPLRELIPYIRNSRTHSDEQIAQIMASLRQFGWTTPMVVAGSGMLAGHARLTAALRLAETGQDIPRNRDPWTGPVVDLSVLSETERRAYIIADNRLAQNAGWDDGMLRLELADLQVSEFDLSVLGFSDKELAKLTTEVSAPEDFPGFDEGIETEHQCPRCGFAWSGATVTRSSPAADDDIPA